MIRRTMIAMACAALASGCAVQPRAERDMSAFTAAAPRLILVVPTVNHSLDVDAPNYVLTTLPVPLAEKGYYVFPVNTTKLVLEQEGFYEGEKIHQQPPESLAKLFGADAILYVTINEAGHSAGVRAGTECHPRRAVPYGAQACEVTRGGCGVACNMGLGAPERPRFLPIELVLILRARGAACTRARAAGRSARSSSIC